MGGGKKQDQAIAPRLPHFLVMAD